MDMKCGHEANQPTVAEGDSTNGFESLSHGL